MRMPSSLRIFWRACRQWVNNSDSRLGAALSYYTLFSIAPLLLIAIHIAGFFFGEDAARGRVVEYLTTYIGKDTAQAIQKLIEAAAQPRTGIWALISLGMVIVGAVTIFIQLRSALCMIWHLEEPPRGNTILGILLDYGLALLMVVITGFLLFLSLAASMVVPIVRDLMEQRFPDYGFNWQFAEFLISVLLLLILFAAMFRVLSGQRIAWGSAFYGAVTTSILFTLGKYALGMYLVYSSTESMYGAAGSLVVLLIWVYYSSQILFFGAELVQARRTRHEWLDNKAAQQTV